MSKKQYGSSLKNHPVIKLFESKKKESDERYSYVKSKGLERYSRIGLIKLVNEEVIKEELSERGITYEQWVKEEFQEEADINYLTPAKRKEEEEADVKNKPKLKRLIDKMYGARKRKLNIILLKQLYLTEKAKVLSLPERMEDESRSVYQIRIRLNPLYSCYEFSRAAGRYVFSSRLFVNYVLTRPEFKKISRKTIQNQMPIIKRSLKKVI